MEIIYLLKGIVIGLSIAAPVGPIGVLCIRRTLVHGKSSGFISGVGAATADGVYGVIAAFGITAVSSVLVDHQFWLRLVGGLFLLYLGIRVLLSKPSNESAKTDKHKGLLNDYFSTFLLTITNPVTIISFAAIFAGLGVSSSHVSSAGLMVAGVIIGSILWWLILVELVGLLKTRLRIESMSYINKISGAILVLFAIIAFVSLYIKL